MNDCDNNKPFVSICCITYNHEAYIRDALEGFLMQNTNFLFEVLIHDDASTDRTADIIREYQVKYPNVIKPIFQTENQYSKGICPSLKFNFPRAKGKYIAMCEGDDYWIDPLKLQKQIDLMEKDESLGLVATNYEIKNQRGSITRQRERKYQYSKWIDSALDLRFISTLTVLMRKAVLDEYVEELYIKQNFCPKSASDFPMWLWFIKKSHAYYSHEVTAVYRQLQLSATNHNGDGNRLMTYCNNVADSVNFLHKYGLLTEVEYSYMLLDVNYMQCSAYILLNNNKSLICSMNVFLKNKNIKYLYYVVKFWLKTNYLVRKKI